MLQRRKVQGRGARQNARMRLLTEFVAEPAGRAVVRLGARQRFRVDVRNQDILHGAVQGSMGCGRVVGLFWRDSSAAPLGVVATHLDAQQLQRLDYGGCPTAYYDGPRGALNVGSELQPLPRHEGDTQEGG